jgi:YaiO family outer membrane protein
VRRALATLALVLPLAARAATVELSQGYETLSGGRPSWRATALDATWTGEGGVAAGGSLRELSRFERDDFEAAAFGQTPFGGFVLALEGSASPTWRFVPRWSGGARADRPFGGGFIASLGARVARFEGPDASTTVTFANAGLERYWGRWRAAATTTAVELEGSWSGGGRLALDLYYGDGGRVGVSAAAGTELESLGGGQVLRTDVLAAALAGAQPLRGGWALTWELSLARQGDLYTRTGGRLGIRRRY